MSKEAAAWLRFALTMIAVGIAVGVYQSKIDANAQAILKNSGEIAAIRAKQNEADRTQSQEEKDTLSKLTALKTQMDFALQKLNRIESMIDNGDIDGRRKRGQ